MPNKKEISKESYKGVRDFYPEDMFIENYIFDTWRRVVESFGYSEYDASILEPTELYRAKTGEEIVNEQIYSFKDRGDREISLRPEMTPTTARLVSKRKRDLVFPLRWYSIPNVFRYEKPQKGRLREHYQLNVDLFGSDNLMADIELILVSREILKAFGAKDSNFLIKINNRKILDELYKKYKLPKDKAVNLSKVIDKKDKIATGAFEEAVDLLLGEKAKEFVSLLHSTPELIKTLSDDNQGIKNVLTIIDKLQERGINNVEFDPSLVRGFDYYNGMVFEIFDTDESNKRSLFGGGRYDNLLEIFGDDPVPAVGFGMGDVTLRDFLETHKLLPEYRPKTEIYIAVVDEESYGYAYDISESLRESGINSEIDVSGKRTQDQAKKADKKGIPFICFVGKNEVKSKEIKVRKMSSGKEEKVPENKVAQFIVDNRS